MPKSISKIAETAGSLSPKKEMKNYSKLICKIITSKWHFSYFKRNWDWSISKLDTVKYFLKYSDDILCREWVRVQLINVLFLKFVPFPFNISLGRPS